MDQFYRKTAGEQGYLGLKVKVDREGMARNSVHGVYIWLFGVSAWNKEYLYLLRPPFEAKSQTQKLEGRYAMRQVLVGQGKAGA